MLLPYMYQQQTCASNAKHMPDVQLLNVHQWVIYTNIYVTYKLATINDVARNYVHRCQVMTLYDGNAGQ